MTSWNLCTSGQAIIKAGLNVNSDIVTSGVGLAKFSEESEGFFNGLTRRDWLANPPASNLAGAVADTISADIGNKIINYDTSGISSAEANRRINVNLFKYNKGIAFLKDKENQKIT